MNLPEPSITINVDLTNPGQFFACCGLLELADRLWPGAQGWFSEEYFLIASGHSEKELLHEICEADLQQIEQNNDTASPLYMSGKFDLRLDWWNNNLTNGKALKVWAGRMSSVRIARAMQHALRDIPDMTLLFDYARVVFDPDNPKKKVEPYYFDSRRGWNARSIDIGFAPDPLNMTTAAYPAVEFLCLVGLQRFRPIATAQRRIYVYFPWNLPLGTCPAAAASSGTLSQRSAQSYRFKIGFRTDQKKHKSFLPATLIGETS